MTEKLRESYYFAGVLNGVLEEIEMNVSDGGGFLGTRSVTRGVPRGLESPEARKEFDNRRVNSKERECMSRLL